MKGPVRTARNGSPARPALVLSGGAARGAYEVGVLRGLLERLPAGHSLPWPIVCGTSVGALNATAMAAWADNPAAGVAALEGVWRSLTPAQLLRPDACGALAMLTGLASRRLRSRLDTEGLSLVDTRAFERLIRRGIPFERIHAQLAAGRLEAVAISTTHVGSGHTVVFVDRRGRAPLDWPGDPTLHARPARLAARHALASAAIPFLFPAVQIGSELYCEGGLRQNVPLAPALRLGADALTVVSPHCVAQVRPVRREGRRHSDPVFLAGKVLNALLLDRIDNDIERLEQINAVLDAGLRRYGVHFVDEINQELAGGPRAPLRRLPTLVIRASQHLGRLAGDFVRSPAFARRHRGLIGKLLRWLGESGEDSEADLLSYVLFDGAFAEQLMELGRADARAHSAELAPLLAVA